MTKLNVTGLPSAAIADTRHAARIKFAADPPDCINPQGVAASLAISDGVIVEGEQGSLSPRVLARARQVTEAIREALLDYREYRIDTGALRQRLKAV
jgi:hypothetical protein